MFLYTDTSQSRKGRVDHRQACKKCNRLQNVAKYTASVTPKMSIIERTFVDQYELKLLPCKERMAIEKSCFYSQVSLHKLHRQYRFVLLTQRAVVSGSACTSRRRSRKRTLGRVQYEKSCLKKSWRGIWTSQAVLVHPWGILHTYLGVQAPLSTMRFWNEKESKSESCGS